jgi:hypothetical protein
MASALPTLATKQAKAIGGLQGAQRIYNHNGDSPIENTTSIIISF